MYSSHRPTSSSSARPPSRATFLPSPEPSRSHELLCAGAPPHVLSTSHVTDSAWFIPVPVLDRRLYPFEYQFGGTLGEGGVGKVMLALNLDTKQESAVKIIAIKRLRTRREMASVANEIKILRRVSQSKSPFLARSAKRHDWFWQYRGNIHLVMEYYRGGDLGRNSSKHKELSDPRLFKLVIAEIVIAILALHDMGIVHHDIKPSNILIDGNGHCVLADYGGSCFMSARGRVEWKKDRTPIFTLRYAAPDVLINGPLGRGYGPSIDFWSLGMTAFELATGMALVQSSDDYKAAHEIEHARIDMTQLARLVPYPGLKGFVEALLVRDESRRLQGSPVKAHPYFTDLTQQNEWALIERKERPPFRSDKQMGVNPRNTSYDYIERPGENLLDDANEDVVNQWFIDEGVDLPHYGHADASRLRR